MKKNLFRRSLLLLLAMLFISSVVPVNAATIKLNVKKKTLYVGQTYSLSLKGATGKITWESSNKKVASVKDGTVTAIAKGKSKISATYNNKTYKCTVTVKKAKISAASSELEAGKTLSLNMNGPKVKKWSSSDSSIATVSGNEKQATVNGLKAGTVAITAKGENGKNYKIVLNICSTTNTISIDGKDLLYKDTPDGGGVIITGVDPDKDYECSSEQFLHGIGTKLTIPSEIGGKKVLEIGESAFSGRSYITSLIISDGVTIIGNDAFNQCHDLISISIPDTVTEIGNNAFILCDKLTSITIPRSVNKIGSSAFDGCSSLSSITIPDSVTHLGDHAFYDCTGLKSVTLSSSLVQIGGCAFENCSGLTSIIIPDNISDLGAGTFRNCTSLSDINIPYRVTTIPSSLFEGCTNLTSLTLPNGITSIDGNAFKNCNSLTQINIPDGVTIIGSRAFEGCKALKNIDFPESLSYIGQYAFADCTGLTNIVIPMPIKKNDYSNLFDYISIADYAFYGCTTLISITLPDNVNEYTNAPRPFYGCTNLKNIYVAKGSVTEKWLQNTEYKDLITYK